VIFVDAAATALRAGSKPRNEPSSWLTYHSPEIGMPPAQKSERNSSARLVMVPPEEMPPM